MISGLINTLTVDVFPAETRAGANGLVGMAGWTGGLLFSLAGGRAVRHHRLRAGCSPAWRWFDILGAAILIAASSGPRPVLRAIA